MTEMKNMQKRKKRKNHHKHYTDFFFLNRKTVKIEIFEFHVITFEPIKI